MIDVILPSLGEGIVKASISFWHRRIGESVKEGEDLVELVTDKATFNMPASASGILKEVLAQEGDEVTIGQVIAKIG